MWLLSRTVPAGCRDAVLGDLEEEFVEEAFTVIGVMPGGSAFDRGRTDVWRPLVFGSNERARNYHWLQVLGRLKPGVTLEQARARMEPIAAQIAHDPEP